VFANIVSLLIATTAAASSPTLPSHDPSRAFAHASGQVHIESPTAAHQRADDPYDWNAIGKHMKAAYTVLERRAANQPAWVRLWRGEDTVIPEAPQWVEHVVTPGERLSQIAVRYGATLAEVKSWNQLRRRTVEAGTRLDVLAVRIPVPRQEIKHRVQAGESWETIAGEYRVEIRELKRHNRAKNDAPQIGDVLSVWYDPAAPWTVGRTLGSTKVLDFEVPQGALSVGRPNRGRILNGVQLPDSPLYARRTPRTLWGSSHSIGALMSAFAMFRYESGHQGEVIVNSMSLQHGRRFAPHKSHQSGRDVDVALPLLPGVVPTISPNADEVDWWATWALVRSLIRTNEVVYIFLDRPLQRRLYDAALSMGATPDELATILEIAQDHRKQSIVRHAKGHDDHIHVRFRCAPYEERCAGQD
jgi:LysM repeat protein